MTDFKLLILTRKFLLIDMVSKLENEITTEKSLKNTLLLFLSSFFPEITDIISEKNYKCIENLFDDMETNKLKEAATQQLTTLLLLYNGILSSKIVDIKKIDTKQIFDFESECIANSKYYLLELLRRLKNV